MSKEENQLCSETCQYFGRTAFFLKDVCSKDVLREIERGYRIFLHGKEAVEKQKDLRDIVHPEHTDFSLSLTSANAFGFDLLDVLTKYFSQKTPFQKLHSDQILTAIHEAYKNALLWSNLELKSNDSGPRAFEFYEEITEKLAMPEYGGRYIHLTINRLQEYTEVCIHIDGLPIIWKKTPGYGEKEFRGTALIKNFSDLVTFDDDHKTIRLYYLH